MIKPLGIHVLIETKPKEQGFVIKPEGTKGEPEEGVILSVGKAVESDELVEGVKVFFRRYSAEPFEIEGKTVYLVEEQDLMGYAEVEAKDE